MTTQRNPDFNFELDNYAQSSGVVEGQHLAIDTANSDAPLQIMMGQTFDNGQPLDLLKYSLLIDGVQNTLARAGIESNANLLLADHFIYEINGDQEERALQTQLQERIEYLERLNAVYGLDIGTVLSSRLSRTPVYQQKLDQLTEELQANPHFKDAALQAIPEDRRHVPEAIRYPLEEIATIESLDTDIKIGPVYEQKYDGPSRDIAAKIGFKVFSSLYATRGYLFGAPELTEDVEASIEEFGILPYKIDSKGQRKYRIDPVNDSPDQVEKLVHTTSDPRSIQDLVAITTLAKRKLEENPSATLDTNSKGVEELKKVAFNAYLCYIYSPITE